MLYLKLYTDFVDVLEPLDDEETGRLFRAMLRYAADGEIPELIGNEKFLWPVAKQGIDRTAEVSETRSSARKQKTTNHNKPQQTITNDDKMQQTTTSDDTPFLKEKVNIKEKEKENISTIVDIKETAAVDGGGWELTEQEITESLNRDRAIEDACRDYGLPCEAGHMIHARDLADQYTLDWLLKAIEIGGSNKQTASWRYVEGVLRKAKERGGIDKPAPSAPKAPAKVLNAQNYEQRNYTDEEMQKAAMMAWASVDDDWS